MTRAQAAAARLSGQEKAAIIVRLLIEQDVRVPLAQMPEHLQAALTEQFGSMRMVDRDTLAAVIEEFAGRLDAVGLAFPGELDGALSMLDGHISPTAADRLRRLAGVSGKADPWERICALEAGRLLPILEGESAEVCAVVLSKLPVSRAAELLRELAGGKARRVAQAVSRTGDIDPETVRRIGMAILGQIDAQKPRAFAPPAAERIGAILNVTPSETRDDLLAQLDADDAPFAQEVRKSIFTFEHIPGRIRPGDIAQIVRAVDQRELVTALAAARTAGGARAEAAEMLLDGVSARMADALRDEVETRGPVRAADGEAAMNAVADAIRELADAGELTFRDPEAEPE